MARKFTGVLTNDTMLMPHIMADAAVREAGIFCRPVREASAELLDELANELVAKAQRVYAGKYNTRWQKAVRGRNGGGYLRSFMRHWLSGMLIARFNVRPPDEFCNGAPVERCISAFQAFPDRWDLYQPLIAEWRQRGMMMP